MNKINNLDFKFRYQILKYNLKDKLMISDATKASGIGTLLHKKIVSFHKANYLHKI
jgi:hypothetical protein